MSMVFPTRETTLLLQGRRESITDDLLWGAFQVVMVLVMTTTTTYYGNADHCNIGYLVRYLFILTITKWRASWNGMDVCFY